MTPLKRVLFIVLHVLIISAFIYLICIPQKGILAYTKNGLKTIRAGAYPCAVCFAPTVKISYAGVRSSRVVNAFCSEHAPPTLSISSGKWAWGGNVMAGWLFGGLLALFLPVFLLVILVTKKGEAQEASKDISILYSLLAFESVYLAVYVIILLI